MQIFHPDTSISKSPAQLSATDTQLKSLTLLIFLLAAPAFAELSLVRGVSTMFLHLLVLMSLGWIISRLIPIDVSGVPSTIDRSILSCGLGLSAIPVWALASSVCSSIIAGLFTILIVGALLVVLRARSVYVADELEQSIVLPFSVYLLSAAYCFISVVLPFRAFTYSSLVREMFSDGFQRFGVLRALADAVPPTNLFFDGAPLSYYWFSFLPMALPLELGVSDIFTAWKAVQIATAVIFVPFVWGVIRICCKSSAIAWGALAFAVFFPSYEILSSPQFWQILDDQFAQGVPRVSAMIEALATFDPDHVVGMLTPYSDQLYLEDFLYIPHNVVALLTVLICCWAITNENWFFALSLSSGLVGINTFVALPTTAAVFIVMLSRCSLRFTSVGLAFALAQGLLWASLCSIIEVRAWTFVPLVLLLGWGFSRLPTEEQQKGIGVQRGVTIVAAGLLFGMAGLAIANERAVVAILFFNYGLAFPLAIVALLMLFCIRRKIVWSNALLFLCSYLLAHLLITILLCLPVSGIKLQVLSSFVEEIGARVSPFNYYHKAAKGARLAMAVLAAFAVVEISRTRLQRVLPARTARPLLIAVGVAVLAPATITSFVRAMSYVKPTLVSERFVGAFLRSSQLSATPIVLLEDFKYSQITQIAPVVTYYYSTWTGAAHGISHLSGTWAEQYLPASRKAEVAQREKALTELFTGHDHPGQLKAFLRTARATHLLAKHPYNFEPCGKLVFSSPGHYLYLVQKACLPNKELE